jgi:hypothetical protein
LIIFAIINLLIGVVLRYAVGGITDHFDLDPVPFTWVEELGEMSLAWLTLIGAAIGVYQRSHFTLHVFVHRLPQPAQLWIHRFNHVLIVGIGVLACVVRLQALPAQCDAAHARPRDQSGLALCLRRRRRRADRALRPRDDLQSAAGRLHPRTEAVHASCSPLPSSSSR